MPWRGRGGCRAVMRQVPRRRTVAGCDQKEDPALRAAGRGPRDRASCRRIASGCGTVITVRITVAIWRRRCAIQYDRTIRQRDRIAVVFGNALGRLWRGSGHIDEALFASATAEFVEGWLGRDHRFGLAGTGGQDADNPNACDNIENFHDGCPWFQVKACHARATPRPWIHLNPL